MAKSRPWILGISSAFHNGAACLIHGDKIVVAIQEERLTRVKREPVKITESSLAIDYCLAVANITPRDLDAIVDCTISLPDNQPIELLRDSPICQAARPDVETFSIPHHLGHAFSAYATSGFEEALVLIIDGGGSFGWQLTESELGVSTSSATDQSCEHTSVYHFTGRGAIPVEKHVSNMWYIFYPPASGMLPFASLGHMFSSVSRQLFSDDLEAGKVMALAPYAKATFPISDFLEIHGERFLFNNRVPRLFPHDDRWPARQKEYSQLAASTQQALEYALDALVKRIQRLNLSTKLCYAGGVALNSVANRKVLRNTTFEDIHIVPAAEDSGPAIGAAYYGLHQLTSVNHSRKRHTDFMGRSYSADEIGASIEQLPGLDTVTTNEPHKTVAELLSGGAIVGWFQGGSEFGPRALGHRSILCDPRRRDAKEVLNSRVKHREGFRPFAPAVMAEHVADWFRTSRRFPPMDFMLEVCEANRSAVEQLPGVVHVDGTSRLQTVIAEHNPDFHALLGEFYRLTGVPVVINTSFNVMGEPIVETPREALWALLTTGIDYCYLEGFLVKKKESFQTVLDLIPVVESQVRKIDENSVSVQTPHGRRVYGDLSAALVRLLNRIDGKTPGRDLFSMGMTSAGQESHNIAQLSLLFRYSMVRFVSTDTKPLPLQ